MGIYATSQFLGAAVGGILGGWLLEKGGFSTVFVGCALLALLWLGVAITMREPDYVTSLQFLLKAKSNKNSLWLKELMSLEGVKTAVVVDRLLYVKVDRKQWDEQYFNQWLKPIIQMD